MYKWSNHGHIIMLTQVLRNPVRVGTHISTYFLSAPSPRSAYSIYWSLWCAMHIGLAPFGSHCFDGPPLCQAPDMYKGFFVVLHDPISWFPYPSPLFLAFNFPCMLAMEHIFNLKKECEKVEISYQVLKMIEIFISRFYLKKIEKVKSLFIQNNVAFCFQSSDSLFMNCYLLNATFILILKFNLLLYFSLFGFLKI